MTACSATARRTHACRGTFALALSAAAITMPASGSGQRLEGEPAPVAESSQQERVHDRLGAADAGLRIDLPPVLRREEEAAAEAAKEMVPLRIGFHRDVPKAFRGNLLPRLSWMGMGDGTLAAALLVSSPPAKSIRVALRADLPPGGALRFFHPGGKKPIALVDPVVPWEELHFADRFWSPSVQGDTIGVEITLPADAAQERASLRLEKIAHRFAE